MAWGGTSISERRAPYLSLLDQITSLALAINKEDLNQKERSSASQLPDTPASATLTLTSAITSHCAPTCRIMCDLHFFASYRSSPDQYVRRVEYSKSFMQASCNQYSFEIF